MSISARSGSSVRAAPAPRDRGDRLSSLILWGPPGTGKTSLASVIARGTKSHFETINAVMAGVADIRKVVAGAQRRRQVANQRTILLVDEIHRFNRSQQDALLPHVEDGTIVLIGATTENPFFDVNTTLLSRSRVFQFRPLEDADVARILRMRSPIASAAWAPPAPR